MYDLGHQSIVPVSTGTSTSEPLDSSSLRDHLRASSSEDSFLAEKIPVARRRIEARTERSYVRNQFDQAIDRFPCDRSPIRLLRSPGVSVESITWYGTTGLATALSTDAYFLDTYSVPPRVCLQSGYSWPTGVRDQVAAVIRFTAGYASSSSPTVGIPDPLIEAIKKLATDLYENREASSLGNSVNEPLPFGVEELLSEFVQPEFG